VQSLNDIDFAALTDRGFHPSPAAWEDQVFYFFLVDRFSDGREKGYLDNAGGLSASGATPMFSLADRENAVQTEPEAAAWREAGARFVGGTLKGAESKIGYLKRMGITALWVSPIFRQPPYTEAYHGYGAQNFLDIDPRFGSREDLRQLVQTAHEQGIYVILDVILNHSGPVFSYDADRYPTRDGMDPRWDGNPYRVAGWHDAAGRSTLPFKPLDTQGPTDGAIWPRELQAPETFTRRGRIDSWDWYPEYLEGDFFDLKDIHHGAGDIDHYQPSPALLALTRIYQYWIAYADLDGFRVDTVKHMDPGATRFFAACIHEFAQSIGKENFYLIGEITGGRVNAFNTLETTGLDAALGIDDIPDKMEYLVKGYRNPEEYFGLFRNSLLVEKESHIWFRNKVVTLYDDHDQVRKGNNKARFCAGGGENAKLALNALALNVLTLGIPCIYYGSEQGFDGSGGNDRYIREAMFGGAFGPFRSRGRHCFDESHPVYGELARLLALRASHMGLRRGRQYLRPISGNGIDFGEPFRIGGRMRSVVAWSRLFTDREWIVAINTDPDVAHGVWVVVDYDLNPVGRRLVCLHSSDPGQTGTETAVAAPRQELRAVWLNLPAAGCAVYGQV
jgi:glycosidase